jgi:hypothetical protein
MATPLSGPAGPAASANAQVDVNVKALARALRQKREEAQALVRLVQQANPPGDKGQHVNYYG